MTNIFVIELRETFRKNSNDYLCRGWERLIRTWLIRSSTKFKVTVNIWQQSYHFMFKMNGYFENG